MSSNYSSERKIKITVSKSKNYLAIVFTFAKTDGLNSSSEIYQKQFDPQTYEHKVYTLKKLISAGFSPNYKGGVSTLTIDRISDKYFKGDETLKPSVFTIKNGKLNKNV